MKKILILFILLIGLKSYSQNTVVNLNLKGSTVKLLVKYIYGNQDTSISNAFYKLREDYIDGTTPNDNANVQISSIQISTIVKLYDLVLNIPAWVIKENDVVQDFKTSITAARAGNATLNTLCDQLEAAYVTRYAELLAEGLKILTSK